MLEFSVYFGLFLVAILPVLLTRYFDICWLCEAHKATPCASYEDDAGGFQYWVNREVALEKRRVRSFIWNMLVGVTGLFCMVAAIGMAREAGQATGLAIFLSFVLVFCIGAAGLRTFYSDENLFDILLRKKYPGVFA